MKTNNKSHKLYRNYLKRIIDIVLSVTALILLCWLFAVIAILVRIKLGSPVLFKQDRPGKNEKIFKLYKFRTMTDERDEDGNLLPDDDRLTKFGRLLRLSSLDELPEILNIIKGDMSIVGPRPLLVKYLPYYTEKQHHRHDVRPGLTGNAQAHGRNGLNWDDKFRMDLEYIDKMSFVTDIKIILDTVICVLRHEGISQEGQATMEDFSEYAIQKNKQMY